jgi:cysteine desulfurase / selenocysteine lyase
MLLLAVLSTSRIVPDDARLGVALAPKVHFPMAGEYVYLDQAAIGLVPTPVLEVMQGFTGDLGRGGTIVLDEEAEVTILDGLRGAAARLIGAEPGQIAVVSSATESLNQFVRWLSPGAGANVVLLDGDFPSVTLPWLRLAEDTGVEVRFVPTRAHPERATAAAIAELVDQRTAAISAGHVQYATGHRLDLSLLSDVAAANDARLVVDATQSVGAVPVDVGQTSVDMLVASSHKWLCAPHGAAFCYLARSMDEFRPPLVGWRGVSAPTNFDARSLHFAPGARRLELGTICYAAGLALEAGIEYLEGLGLARIQRQHLYLSECLSLGLAELGADVLTPTAAHQRAGIVAARFSRRDPEALVARLRRRRIVASARQGAVRFAVHVFNDRADIDHVLDVLRDETI